MQILSTEVDDARITEDVREELVEGSVHRPGSGLDPEGDAITNGSVGVEGKLLLDLAVLDRGRDGRVG